MAARLGDELFQAPSDRLADALSAVSPSVWRYLFSWPSAALGGRLGACHSLELPFVFDNLQLPGIERFTGPRPPQDLADRIGAEWTALARHGSPSAGWPPYTAAERQSLVF
jgi:para-nitrobenzyl esterase